MDELEYDEQLWMDKLLRRLQEAELRGHGVQLDNREAGYLRELLAKRFGVMQLSEWVSHGI